MQRSAPLASYSHSSNKSRNIGYRLRASYRQIHSRMANERIPPIEEPLRYTRRATANCEPRLFSAIYLIRQMHNGEQNHFGRPHSFLIHSKSRPVQLSTPELLKKIKHFLQHEWGHCNLLSWKYRLWTIFDQLTSAETPPFISFYLMFCSANQDKELSLSIGRKAIPRLWLSTSAADYQYSRFFYSLAPQPKTKRACVFLRSAATQYDPA